MDSRLVSRGGLERIRLKTRLGVNPVPYGSYQSLSVKTMFLLFGAPLDGYLFRGCLDEN